MKKNALVVVVLLISLVLVSVAFGKDVSKTESNSTAITIEQARRIALLKVSGTIQNEYSIQDEDENITMYVFSIKDNQGRIFEVQVDANRGEVLSISDLGESSKEAMEKSSEEPEKSEGFDEDYESAEVVESYPLDAYIPFEPNPNVNYANGRNTSNTITTEIPPQFTMEQARFVAILRINGEIKSEKSIVEDGRLTYMFLINCKNGSTAEVRVDAISGKARRIKNRRLSS